MRVQSSFTGFSLRHSLTFVDSAETSVVHLVGAVEDDDVFAEAATHVLGRLGFAGSGWTRRCSTQRHPQRLRQRDVASAEQTHIGCSEVPIY